MIPDKPQLPETISTKFLDQTPEWANHTILRSWSELQWFVEASDETEFWKPIDPRNIVGCFHGAYAKSTFASALHHSRLESLRMMLKEDPSFIWDTGWQLRNMDYIGNWTIYDAGGPLFVDGDGTKRTILARFIAQENDMPLLLAPNYKRVHVCLEEIPVKASAHGNLSRLIPNWLKQS